MVADDAAPAKYRSTASLGYFTGVLLAAWILALADRMILIMLIPGIKASLLLSDTQASLLHGFAFSVFFTVAALPAGRWVDRANRRNVLILAVVGWSLATVACGLANSFATLFAARAMVGVSQAVLAPATFSMLADLCADTRRGRVTAVLVSGGTLGASMSLMLGGVLVDALAHSAIPSPFGGVLAPWQATLVFVGSPGLVLVAFLLALREPERHERVAGGQFGLLPFLSGNWSVFAPLLTAFVLMQFVGNGVASWFPVLLMRNTGMAPQAAGLITGVGNLVAAGLAAAVGGMLIDRAGRRDPQVGRLKLLRVLMLAAAVGLLPLMVVKPQSVVGALLVYSTVATTISSLIYTILPELAPNEGRGQVIAVSSLLNSAIGMGLGPTAIALVTDGVLHDEMRVNVSMLVLGVPGVLLAALCVTLALPATRRLRASLMEATEGRRS